MKISLIHTSRGRSRKAELTATIWNKKAYNVDNIEYILSIDDSDPELINYRKLFNDDKYKILVSDNSNLVEATNRGCKIATGDILIYVSDDFEPPYDWDKSLIEIAEKQDREDYLIKVDDCLQPFDNCVLTIPIMSKGLFDKLGYFWHPSYKSIWVDVDLYFTCKDLDCMVLCPDLKFEHKHYSNGKADVDETYKASEANSIQGLQVIINRINQNRWFRKYRPQMQWVHGERKRARKMGVKL